MTRKNATNKLGIHYHTLYAMAKRGEIEAISIGRRQMYNVDKYLKNKGVQEIEGRKRICYCRVSSRKQKDDLTNQIEVMKNKFPAYEIISDIGSGLNYNREGLRKIIDYAINGKLEILVVAYKDRLARIGYELIENLIKELLKR